MTVVSKRTMEIAEAMEGLLRSKAEVKLAEEGRTWSQLAWASLAGRKLDSLQRDLRQNGESAVRATMRNAALYLASEGRALIRDINMRPVDATTTTYAPSWTVAYLDHRVLARVHETADAALTALAERSQNKARSVVSLLTRHGFDVKVGLTTPSHAFSDRPNADALSYPASLVITLGAFSVDPAEVIASSDSTLEKLLEVISVGVRVL